MKKTVTVQWDENDVTSGRQAVLKAGTHLIATRFIEAHVPAAYMVIHIDRGTAVFEGSRGECALFLTGENAEPR